MTLHARTDSSKNTAAGYILEWLDSIVISIFVVITMFTFFFSIVKVDGSSMENTMFDSDRLIISDFCYTPKNGDIVIISRNYDNLGTDDEQNDFSEPIVKRVIAIAGQRVRISDGSVYVNGEKLIEDYTTTPTDKRQLEGEQTVPEGCIFVLGDNRAVSHDSRMIDIGMVDERYVMGKVLCRFLPMSEFKIF